jgi:2-polyprenyl-6-methoxyphenol hydroxylase-like FAD-dependent oxidoreductase
LTGETLKVQCCIAGGGPAGMMLGLLLARAGVNVVVLEKHSDFLRDFRGDTIHPSTLEVLHELGLLEEFLKLPHQKVHELGAYIGDRAIPFADFTHLPTRIHHLDEDGNISEVFHGDSFVCVNNVIPKKGIIKCSE